MKALMMIHVGKWAAEGSVELMECPDFKVNGEETLVPI